MDTISNFLANPIINLVAALIISIIGAFAYQIINKYLESGSTKRAIRALFKYGCKISEIRYLHNRGLITFKLVKNISEEISLLIFGLSLLALNVLYSYYINNTDLFYDPFFKNSYLPRAMIYVLPILSGIIIGSHIIIKISNTLFYTNVMQMRRAIYKFHGKLDKSPDGISDKQISALKDLAIGEISPKEARKIIGEYVDDIKSYDYIVRDRGSDNVNRDTEDAQQRT